MRKTIEDLDVSITDESYQAGLQEIINNLKTIEPPLLGEKEIEELKEYIAIAPNLDEMTAIKYRNIQQDAYIQGRAEEQQKAKQIIYENYIPIQKVKDKIEEYKNMLKTCNKAKDIDRIKAINERILELQELIERKNNNE